MYNTKTDIIDRNTYVDEFEREVKPTAQPVRELTPEERAFNSRISENFDKIVNYEVYQKQEALKERANQYSTYNGVGVDCSPSSTTMQFYGMPKSNIYEDYKVESTYETTTKVRPRAKVLMAFAVLVVMLLSTLIIFNTILLHDLNKDILSKQTEIAKLTEDKTVLDGILEEVSNTENIVNSATGNGMAK
jgi:cell division protein FtsL